MKKTTKMALCARKISKIAAWKWVFFRLWETETLAPGGNPPGALFFITISWIYDMIISNGNK